MKLLAETTGEFMLHSPVEEQSIEADRPGVVRQTAFTNRAAAEGRIKVLHQLADSASDAEFQETFADSGGDAELAVAAYSAMHPLEVIEPTPTPKVAKQPKAAKPDVEAK